MLGLTRKTVYLYLRIDELLRKYPRLFDESFITRIGSTKMDKLIVGINRIENSILPPAIRTTKIEELVFSIDIKMSVGEVEDLVLKKTKSLR